MKRYFYFLISGFFFFLCYNETKQDGLPEISVDIDNITSQLLLSNFAESITSVGLELTDESLIHPGRLMRIILTEEKIFIAQRENIIVFDKTGNFIRSIGSKGQGPGEYISIQNMTVDEKNKRLFVNSATKIICYDFNGNVLKDHSVFQSNNYGNQIHDINYINNELLAVVWTVGEDDEHGIFNQAQVYRMDNEFQITDSCSIMKKYGVTSTSFNNSLTHILLALNSAVYVCYPFSDAISPMHRDMIRTRIKGPLTTFMQDTIFRLENSQLVPELKLKFKNDGIDMGNELFIYPVFFFAVHDMFL